MMSGVDQLRDIRGLDPASWWPPAPGWWLVLVGLLVLAGLAAILWRWLRRPRGDWRGDAARQIRRVRGDMRWADARTLAGEISELLRRISMARFGRRSCAGLVGMQWLEWLEAHDPAQFPWRREGRVLVELPYAPAGKRSEAAAKLAPLLDAMEAWVRLEETVPAPVPSRSRIAGLWRRWPRWGTVRRLRREAGGGGNV